MTLNDLREKLKVSFAAFLDYRVDWGEAAESTKNMRQWAGWAIRYKRDCEELVEDNVQRDSVQFSNPYHTLVMNLARDGQLYYYAKKHGMDAAMLFKLSQA